MDVQTIQKTLNEFIGNRKARKIAVDISVAIQKETQYIHKKGRVKAILNAYLERDDVQECLDLLIAERLLGETKPNAETMELEPIKIEGSNSRIYAELMQHKIVYGEEKGFMKALEEAISASLDTFHVPVCDPSIDEKGKLQFLPGFEPAWLSSIGYSYNKLENLAKENNVRLGSRLEYVLFLGTMISRLIAEGWTEEKAWHAVCIDSQKLGHYFNPTDEIFDAERTGSRMIAGKCDLANACKVLAKEAGGFWIAGGCWKHSSIAYPLASIDFYDNFERRLNDSVGWYVF